MAQKKAPKMIAKRGLRCWADRRGHKSRQKDGDGLVSSDLRLGLHWSHGRLKRGLGKE